MSPHARERTGWRWCRVCGGRRWTSGGGEFWRRWGSV